jgi:hypothetical protein
MLRLGLCLYRSWNGKTTYNPESVRRDVHEQVGVPSGAVARLHIYAII